ncbi:MAG: serine hydrolase domain-containing protein [Deltaproteobacteria bacterium]
MTSPIDIFAAGARDGVYPGGQLAASREMKRIVTAAVGRIGPGLEPTSDKVNYDLASLTKPLATTVLVGKALETGLCDLTDPICKFVPGVDPEIRIEHVLEHSAGFPAHQRFDRTLPDTVTPGSWDAWRHIVFRAAHTPRTARPGLKSEYSDIGFILLGAALEVMFCRPLSIAYAQLGTHLFYRDRRGTPALPPFLPPWPIAPTEDDCAIGFVHDENCRAMGGAAGHAGLWGNAEGTLLLAEQLVAAYHGDRRCLLQPETVRRLWQPSLVKGSTRTLGFDRPSKVGSSTGGRWPSSSVGHLGFTGTSLWIEPDRALIVVLVTNRVCPTRANNMIRRLRPALHDAAWTSWARPMVRPRKRRAAGVRALPPDRAPTMRIEIDSGERPTDPQVPAKKRRRQ